jgi:hypothetical protein
MTDQPTPAQPGRDAMEKAREERDAAAREAGEHAEQARDEEAQEVWSQMEQARDRAEAMGDRVEEGTRETGTGSRTSSE